MLWWRARHRHHHRTTLIRFVTYLVPGLPLELSELLARGLGVDAEVIVDSSASGPAPDGTDPFTLGQAEIGFMCAPPYLDLRRRSPSPVELLGVAPVFDDPRAEGRPVYFAELVVRPGLRVEGVADLAGAVLGINDQRSLSGLIGFELLLAEHGLSRSDLGGVCATGSHEASLEQLASGAIDVATIDSNTFRRLRAIDDPAASAVRHLRTIGPLPAQPIVVSSRLPTVRRTALRDRLVEFVSARRCQFEQLDVIGISPIDDGEYAELDRALDSLHPERRRTHRPGTTEC